MALKDLIGKNKYKDDISVAKELQNEASYYISYDPTNPYDCDFKKRVKEIYVGDNNKTNRFFKAFAGRILPSIELTETIYSHLYRVWDSQNPVREFNFKNSDLNAEATQYISRFDTWWMNTWWNAYKHQFCSFVVIDLPTEQSTFRPEPYPFILDVGDVLYFELTKNQELKEIIFKSVEYVNDEPKLFYYYYTDQFYSKYLIDGENEILQFINPHRLDRCPVHKLWDSKLNSSSWLLSEGAITPNHDDLFWYIVKTIESRKADLLYLNPTTQMPKLSCGWDSTKTGPQEHYKNYYADAKCSGGYLVTNKGNPIISESGDHALCPNCGEKRTMSGGAGNVIQIDLDTTAIKEGKVNPNDTLVKYITPDIDGAKEQFQRIRDLKDMIIKQSVGSDDQPTKSAVNELQQTAIFESKESVLKRISEGLSQVRTKVDKDIFELRYGEMFSSNKYSQGTKFYLYTEDELLDRRKLAIDPIQKRRIDEQIIEVKYRNNQKKLNEEKLLYKLLPFSSMTDEEFMASVKDGLIVGGDQIGLRLQFSDAIEKFESNHGNIVDFFNKFSDSILEGTRVERIRNMLIKLIKPINYVQNQVSG